MSFETDWKRLDILVSVPSNQIWFNQQSACGSFPHHEAPSVPVPEAYDRILEIIAKP
jgi:hypothetical protein